ncbi:hypothetical protein GGQ21_002519 [Salinibacter ruber]|uniref:hypothetical protein n=1 Tax=Salinibacter ruber TaxID=146919 RepID=UPI00216A65C9|nr:hypothetical protein [Salinibacter ruber]MCS3671849.1 hypothetical protein [Salinibacter ruber]MCS4142812.1 hypothetical protein [Salinibacter ruber]
MSQPEYLVALISIIVGLGLTDLAQSVQELIRPGHTVRWDGLPLGWAAFTFLLTILLWWQGFATFENPDATGDATGEAGPLFLSALLIFLLLYLCCAFALPDPDWERADSDWEGSSAASESISEKSTSGGSPFGQSISEEDLPGEGAILRQSGGLRQGVDLEAFYFSAGQRRWFFGLLIAFWIAIGIANQLSSGAGGAVAGGASALLALPIFTDRRWVHWTVVVVMTGGIGWQVVRGILL